MHCLFILIFLLALGFGIRFVTHTWPISGDALAAAIGLKLVNRPSTHPVLSRMAVLIRALGWSLSTIWILQICCWRILPGEGNPAVTDLERFALRVEEGAPIWLRWDLRLYGGVMLFPLAIVFVSQSRAFARFVKVKAFAVGLSMAFAFVASFIYFGAVAGAALESKLHEKLESRIVQLHERKLEFRARLMALNGCREAIDEMNSSAKAQLRGLLDAIAKPPYGEKGRKAVVEAVVAEEYAPLEEAEIARAVGGFRSQAKAGRLFVGPATDITVMSTVAARTIDETRVALEAAKSAEAASEAAVLASDALHALEAAKGAEAAAEAPRLFRFLR